jgi:phage shock protein A
MHAVLDRMEEPELLLKQAIREMEEALDQDERQSKLFALEAKQIASRQKHLSQRLHEADHELDLCFDNGNETLARSLLKRKLEAIRFLHFLDEKQSELQANAGTLNQHIEQNRAELEHLRQKAALLSPQTPSEEAAPGWHEPEFIHRFKVSEEEVELALLRERQQRAQS